MLLFANYHTQESSGAVQSLAFVVNGTILSHRERDLGIM
jgi:hypothetical protein